MRDPAGRGRKQPQVRFAGDAAFASSLTDGAMMTSVKSLPISSRSLGVQFLVERMMPPNAEVESQASARR